MKMAFEVNLKIVLLFHKGLTLNLQKKLAKM